MVLNAVASANGETGVRRQGGEKGFDQGRLAHTGFTADQHELALTALGKGQTVLELTELMGASDERLSVPEQIPAKCGYWCAEAVTLAAHGFNVLGIVEVVLKDVAQFMDADPKYVGADVLPLPSMLLQL